MQVCFRFAQFCFLAVAFSCGAMLAARLDAADGMQYPLSIASHNKTLFVADRNLPGVWKIADGKGSVFFQASKKFRTPLNAVRCVAIDKDGKLLAGDSSTREVFRFDDTGKPQPLTDGEIGIPMAIAVHSSGDLYVADLELHRIVIVPADGSKPRDFIEVPAPRGVAFDSEDRLWIVSHGPNHLLRADAEGKLETVVEGRVFEFAHTIVVDSQGVAYVADGYAKAIWRIAPGEKPKKWVSGEPLDNPVGLTLDGDSVIVVDPRANAIFRIEGEGKLARVPVEIAR